MPLERLQKILAHAGYGSRRACEQLLRDGRVTLDGRVVRELGTKADPAAQDLRCDGEAVIKEKRLWLAVHKPRGVLCTNRDERGRPTVVGLLGSVTQRLYTAGRLDQDSAGLVIVTNDGALAQALTHPSHELSKTYEIRARGAVAPETLRRMTDGVWSSDGKLRFARARITRRAPNATVLEAELREGKNRQIRRVLARLGLKVQRLTRVRIGPVALGDLPPGAHRHLSTAEVAGLRRLAAANPERSGRGVSRGAAASRKKKPRASK